MSPEALLIRCESCKKYNYIGKFYSSEEELETIRELLREGYRCVYCKNTMEFELSKYEEKLSMDIALRSR